MDGTSSLNKILQSLSGGGASDIGSKIRSQYPGQVATNVPDDILGAALLNRFPALSPYNNAATGLGAINQYLQSQKTAGTLQSDITKSKTDAAQAQLKLKYDTIDPSTGLSPSKAQDIRASAKSDQIKYLQNLGNQYVQTKGVIESILSGPGGFDQAKDASKFGTGLLQGLAEDNPIAAQIPGLGGVQSYESSRRAAAMALNGIFAAQGSNVRGGAYTIDNLEKLLPSVHHTDEQNRKGISQLDSLIKGKFGVGLDPDLIKKYGPQKATMPAIPKKGTSYQQGGYKITVK